MTNKPNDKSSHNPKQSTSHILTALVSLFTKLPSADDKAAGKVPHVHGAAAGMTESIEKARKPHSYSEKRRQLFTTSRPGQPVAERMRRQLAKSHTSTARPQE